MHPQGLEFELASVRLRLIRARQLAGLSQGLAARLLGVSRPTVSHLESGKQDLSLRWLLRLAELYHVPADAVVGSGTWKDANGWLYSLNPGCWPCRSADGCRLPYLLGPSVCSPTTRPAVAEGTAAAASSGESRSGS